MNVQPIDRQSAAAACASALRRAILRGELRSGERLPPERKLAEDFGVNRLTLRAALSQLVALGLVKVRQGSGYTVADVARVGGPDLLPDLIELSQETGSLLALTSDLLEVRRSLAGTILSRLAQSADDSALSRITAAVDNFARLCQDGSIRIADLVDADFAIVAAMVDETRSPILRMCINPVVLAVAQIRELTAAMYIDPKDNLAGHRTLLQWLAKPAIAPISAVLQVLAERDRLTLSLMKTALETP